MKQNGFTLVELMVGLAVAMLCMTMMLTVYAQINQIGSDAMRATEYDAQLETGVLIGQKLVQNAGYGVDPTTVTTPNIVVIPVSGNTPVILYWRERPDITATPITYKCSKVTETITPKGSQGFTHRLLLQETNNCGTNAIDSVTYGASARTIVKIDSTGSSSNMPIFNLNVGTGCSPFGTSGMTGGGAFNGKLITITGKRLDISNPISRSVCLRNIT